MDKFACILQNPRYAFHTGIFAVYLCATLKLCVICWTRSPWPRVLYSSPVGSRPHCRTSILGRDAVDVAGESA